MNLAAPVQAPLRQGQALAARYAAVRAATVALAAPLSPEDAMLQSMEDASPAKWHLAHTTWFFEHFVLGAAGMEPLQPHWHYLFNSYYDSAGPRQPRPQRGLLSRPPLEAVLAWREAVDARVLRALKGGALGPAQLRRLELGLHHEQQHQELLLTDIKHGLWSQPLRPAYRPDLPDPAIDPAVPAPLRWIEAGGQVATIGAPAWPQAPDFAYDNESPPHQVFLAPHALASRPASNAEYRQFVEDGGYRDPRLWLSDGWARVQAEGWQRPLYWEPDLEQAFTLGGARALQPHAPVCHVSYYEADAFARWAGARLPTEAEWERAARTAAPQGRFADEGMLEPCATPPDPGHGFLQLFGDAWEWTASAYLAYPGFRPWQDDTGEYNAKFMSGQFVLRGGSCATPRGHVRASYRNFFPPHARWQFSGLRLARDLAQA
ncbi:ergothioneine biosynthesis protein EgtB [Pseudoxanthomonas suwonensis]